MKTLRQIQRKIQTLKRNLAKKQIYENFGDKEQRILKDYIGDIYSYSYENRLKIDSMTQQFFDWCSTYTG